MNLVLTKLKFVEIADDLNASFLEMRISEKNFFLYKDVTALDEIDNKVKNTLESIESAKDNITRAIGEENLGRLKTYLKGYAKAVEEVRSHGVSDTESEMELRAKGKELREFSQTITELERKNVNAIILKSKEILFVSFLVILLLSVFGGHFISQKIVESMREIERLALSISKGTFEKLDTIKSDNDECASVIRAMNMMSDELKNREDEIIQSKKLASLGILTAGVAHELRNPLNNISMVAQNFVEMHDSLSRDQRIELMARVEEETKRIEEIVKNLLDFAKPKVANLKEADINGTISKAVKLMQNTLDISNIELNLSLDSSIPHVFIDKSQMQQVLVNLILNAVQAMSPGGKLSIKTQAGAEDSVTIEVTDTGKGIPHEFLPYIFDPFFSTKGVEGTGLGMSISYAIIRNHKGNIKVESTVNAGTTFTIDLPVYKK